MMLWAVETQVSDWCVSIRVVLLVKFVGELSLLFVCSAYRSLQVVCRPQVAVGMGSVNHFRTVSNAFGNVAVNYVIRV